MKTLAIFYHAGCPVCVAAETQVAQALDRNRYDVQIVHLGKEKSRVAEAEKAGVESVPALVVGGQPFHINHGADLAALKKWNLPHNHAWKMGIARREKRESSIMPEGLLNGGSVGDLAALIAYQDATTSRWRGWEGKGFF